MEPPIKSLGDIEATIVRLVSFAGRLFWVLAVGFAIYAAFKFLTAGGDEKKVGGAKKMVLYTVVAAIVALLANGIEAITYGILKGG